MDELSNVWCEYAEMEIRADEFDNALNLMKVRRTAQESRSALRNVQPCTAIQCETDKIRRSVADNCTRPTGKQNTQSHGIRCGADPTPPQRAAGAAGADGRVGTVSAGGTIRLPVGTVSGSFLPSFHTIGRPLMRHQ